MSGINVHVQTHCTAPIVKGSVFMLRFRIYLGQCDLIAGREDLVVMLIFRIYLGQCDLSAGREDLVVMLPSIVGIL